MTSAKGNPTSRAAGRASDWFRLAVGNLFRPRGGNEQAAELELEEPP
jgi:hypothetical protein